MRNIPRLIAKLAEESSTFNVNYVKSVSFHRMVGSGLMKSAKQHGSQLRKIEKFGSRVLWQYKSFYLLFVSSAFSHLKAIVRERLLP